MTRYAVSVRAVGARSVEGPASVSFLFSYEAAGDGAAQEKIQKPERIRWDLSCHSHASAKFSSGEHLLAMVDGVRADFGPVSRAVRVSHDREGIVFDERLTVFLPTGLFVRLVSSQIVELRVGSYEMEFSRSASEDLTAMAEQIETGEPRFSRERPSDNDDIIDRVTGRDTPKPGAERIRPP